MDFTTLWTLACRYIQVSRAIVSPRRTITSVGSAPSSTFTKLKPNQSYTPRVSGEVLWRRGGGGQYQNFEAWAACARNDSNKAAVSVARTRGVTFLALVVPKHMKERGRKSTRRQRVQIYKAL